MVVAAAVVVVTVEVTVEVIVLGLGLSPGFGMEVGVFSPTSLPMAFPTLGMLGAAAGAAGTLAGRSGVSFEPCFLLSSRGGLDMFGGSEERRERREGSFISGVYGVFVRGVLLTGRSSGDDPMVIFGKRFSVVPYLAIGNLEGIGKYHVLDCDISFLRP